MSTQPKEQDMVIATWSEIVAMGEASDDERPWSFERRVAWSETHQALILAERGER